MRALVESLAADDAILVETVETLRATIPGYEDVPAESLEASARRNRALSIRTILDGQAPEPEGIDEAETLTEERMAQGVEIASVLAGFRACMSIILRHLLAAAPRYGVPVETVLSFSTLLWSLGDAFTTRAVVSYRDRTIAQAVADSARRAHWLGAALAGSLDRTALFAGASVFGVPRDRPVRALCAEGATPLTLEGWAEGTGARAVVVPQGTGAIGMLIGEPDAGPSPAGATIALGAPVVLEELPRSFDMATRVLASAQRVGARGIVDVDRLSWRMGVFASPETTVLLDEIYVEPLREEGAFGELIVEAVRAYLEHRMNIPAAAESIPVHVNTLRYRLRRYRELTGADLGDLNTLIEVAWALAADQG
ncbi:helix-turn-helix domain-containing protein [Cellulosimicrobium funkei]|nr:helix-turn-helix domain-containing protein [Cellulosimicrobium funkei]